MSRTLMWTLPTLLLAACITDAGEARFRGASELYAGCTTVCGADLTVEGWDARLEVRDEAGAVVATSSGSITQAGMTSLHAMQDGLTRDWAALQASECTDCTLPHQLHVGWVEGPLNTYEFGAQPPAALAGIDGFATALRDALAACVAATEVDPDAACVPVTLPLQ